MAVQLPIKNSHIQPERRGETFTIFSFALYVRIRSQLLFSFKVKPTLNCVHSLFISLRGEILWPCTFYLVWCHFFYNFLPVKKFRLSQVVHHDYQSSSKKVVLFHSPAGFHKLELKSHEKISENSIPDQIPNCFYRFYSTKQHK